jgi:uncharacterized membrane protein
MKTMSKKFLFFLSIFLFFLSFLSPTSFARTNITDWYVKNYETEVIVNKDSSLLITEKIIADCGSLPNKHGIFRILPYEIKTDKGIIKMPIKLISITDFNGNPYKFQTLTNYQDKTITWKIGDPNKTVSNENNYQIVYQINNAIRFSDQNFDELYYNLLGTFWQLDIDNFSAKIIFPQEITKDNAKIYLYSGYQGEKTNFLADYSWQNDNSLYISSKTTLSKDQGITFSITIPKGIFQKPSIFITFNKAYLLYLIPLIVFIMSFKTWKKYGKDPHYDKKTIIPEFEVPENLTPLEASMMLLNNFILQNGAITATLIYFATKGLLTIEEKESSMLMPRTFIFHKIKDPVDEFKDLEAETLLFNTIFPNDCKENGTVSFGKLFRKNKGKIKKVIYRDLANKNLVSEKSLLLRDKFSIATIIILFLAFFLIAFAKFSVPFFLTSFILCIFGTFLPLTTLKGQEVKWRLKGFKLYLKTAEKYRAQFYEKENIFEKFLPYVIAFEMTKLWITKMKQIYGEQYMNNYVSGWYISSSGSKTQMDFNSFATSLSHISSSMSSSMGGSSGAGGGGFSGGGGGGGGGGGW